MHASKPWRLRAVSFWPSQPDPPRRETSAARYLAANDGFASIGTGVTGGANATAAFVFVARTRAELVAALTAAPAGEPASSTSTGRST